MVLRCQRYVRAYLEPGLILLDKLKFELEKGVLRQDTDFCRQCEKGAPGSPEACRPIGLGASKLCKIFLGTLEKNNSAGLSRRGTAKRKICGRQKLKAAGDSGTTMSRTS